MKEREAMTQKSPEETQIIGADPRDAERPRLISNLRKSARARACIMPSVLHAECP